MKLVAQTNLVFTFGPPRTIEPNNYLVCVGWGTARAHEISWDKAYIHVIK